MSPSAHGRPAWASSAAHLSCCMLLELWVGPLLSKLVTLLDGCSRHAQSLQHAGVSADRQHDMLCNPAAQCRLGPPRRQTLAQWLQRQVQRRQHTACQHEIGSRPAMCYCLTSATGSTVSRLNPWIPMLEGCPGRCLSLHKASPPMLCDLTKPSRSINSCLASPSPSPVADALLWDHEQVQRSWKMLLAEAEFEECLKAPVRSARAQSAPFEWPHPPAGAAAPPHCSGGFHATQFPPQHAAAAAGLSRLCLGAYDPSICTGRADCVFICWQEQNSFCKPASAHCLTMGVPLLKL